jgi:periplasmic divalent cation tolerance protein
MASKYCVVMVTAPQHIVQTIKDTILEKKLAACVSVIPNVMSSYIWQGAVKGDMESLIIIKTRSALMKKLEAEIKKLHTYDVPEIISIPIEGGNEKYLSWIAKSTKG